jgi:hypothetical protein
MTWKLTYILLSGTFYQASFSNQTDCIEHLHEVAVITKDDLWMGRCDGPHEQAFSISKEGLAP